MNNGSVSEQNDIDAARTRLSYITWYCLAHDSLSRNTGSSHIDNEPHDSTAFHSDGGRSSKDVLDFKRLPQTQLLRNLRLPIHLMLSISTKLESVDFTTYRIARGELHSEAAMLSGSPMLRRPESDRSAPSFNYL